MRKFEQKVTRGIMLLDEMEGGPSWREHIDLEALDLQDCEFCVLGQLHGTFSVGRSNLDIEWGDAWKYGFDRHPDDDPSEYKELTREWIKQLTEEE